MQEQEKNNKHKNPDKREHGQGSEKQADKTPEGIKAKPEESVMKELEEKIKQMEQDARDAKDKYLRAHAEMDNSRKRMDKEKDSFVKFTRAETIGAILPVLDNMERGLAAADAVKEAGPLKDGIDMTIKQFRDIITKLGASEIDTNGKYNPHLHHVLQKEYREDKEEGEITHVLQKGYTLDRALIREASVVIATKEKPVSGDKS